MLWSLNFTDSSSRNSIFVEKTLNELPFIIRSILSDAYRMGTFVFTINTHSLTTEIFKVKNGVDSVMF